LPDGSTTIASFPGAASPEAPNHLALPEIVFNEVVPDLELRNVSAAGVDASGWFLSDDPINLQKYALPAGSIIPAGGYFAVAGAALPFPFDAVHGGHVYLSHGFAQTSEDYDATEGLSIGKVTTSTGTDFVRLSAATFGAANAAPQVGPLVISEIQYHPSIPVRTMRMSSSRSAYQRRARGCERLGSRERGRVRLPQRHHSRRR